MAFMGFHMYLKRECLDGIGGIIIVGKSLAKDCFKEWNSEYLLMILLFSYKIT